MSRRIDIELTSQMGDGSWTWRAAGARQPKGTVEAALVPPGEAVGAVLRADVEIGLEGIEILALTSAKPARSPEKTEGRIEVKGTPRRAPDVSVILAPGSNKRRRDRDDDGDRGDRGDRGARRSGGNRRGPEGEGPREERGGDRPPRGAGGPRRPGARRPGEGEGRPARGERPVSQVIASISSNSATSTSAARIRWRSRARLVENSSWAKMGCATIGQSYSDGPAQVGLFSHTMVQTGRSWHVVC